MSISSYADKLAISFQKNVHIFNIEDGAHTQIEMATPVLDAQISSTYAFIATNDKNVSSYTLAGAKMAEQTLKKKPTKVCRISDDQFVVADRFGDLLYLRVQINEDKTSCFKKTSGSGHLALITDMVYSDGFLISSDREEAIWITRFPKTWVIENFCYGHRRYVSKLCLFDEDNLISGGGDGVLFVFNWRTKDTRSQYKVVEGDMPKTFSITNIVRCGKQVFVTTNQKNEILAFDFDSETGTLKLDRTIALQCKEITALHFLEKQGIILVLDRDGVLTTLTSDLTPLANDFTKTLQDTLKASIQEEIVFEPLYEVFPRHVQTRDRKMKKKRKAENTGDKQAKKQKTEEPKQE